MKVDLNARQIFPPEKIFLSLFSSVLNIFSSRLLKSSAGSETMTRSSAAVQPVIDSVVNAANRISRGP